MPTYTKETLPPWPILQGHHAGKPVARRRAEIAVGSVAFRQDQNHRVYLKDGTSTFGTTLKRYHFVPMLVVGETRVSWIAKGEFGESKFKKGEHALYGLDDVDDYLWCQEHAPQIARMLTNCTDADKIKQIAGILGYTEK